MPIFRQTTLGSEPSDFQFTLKPRTMTSSGAVICAALSFRPSKLSSSKKNCPGRARIVSIVEKKCPPLRSSNVLRLGVSNQTKEESQ